MKFQYCRLGYRVNIHSFFVIKRKSRQNCWHIFWDCWYKGANLLPLWESGSIFQYFCMESVEYV
jgi:hypothetical protein